jgi:hypothetical protein
MKPGEFDDLVRQKFDQADFEYNPRNWEKLTEELDGQKKRRGGLLFWWMPVVGVAASVAMAFGLSTVIRDGSRLNGYTAQPQVAAAIKHKASPAGKSNNITPANIISAQDDNAAVLTEENTTVTPAAADKNTIAAASATTTKTEKHSEGTQVAVTVPGTFKSAAATFEETTKESLAKKKKAVAVSNGYYTFREPAEIKKDPKVAIILSGGVNYSNNSNGYMVGATARRMISDKVYIESDIAFIGTNNSRKVEYMDYSAANAGASAAAMPAGYAAKGTLTAGKNTDQVQKGTSTDPVGVLKTSTQSYNLYYAQVTPSIGYKLAKRISVGLGPDFQQMLVDNRPEINTADRGNIKVAPIFDMGFMGKTEIAVTKNVKAAVYYREGINNVITPTNKYIDRNYLQFQIKCAILNR